MTRYPVDAGEIVPADLEARLARIRRTIALLCHKLTPETIDSIVLTAPKSARRLATYLCKHPVELARWTTANRAERQKLVLRAVLAPRLR